MLSFAQPASPMPIPAPNPLRRISIIPPTANIYEIPYRSLTPQDLDNVLVSGRCLSATHEALAAVRVMPPCFAMGEAAGIAAAWTVRDGATIHDTDVVALQRQLLDQGAYLGPQLEESAGSTATHP